MPQTHNSICTINNKKILLLDQRLSKTTVTQSKIKIDAIIITGDIKNSMRELWQIFDCDLYITSGKIPLWKCAQWKKDCEQLHLRLHSVTQQAAFVLKI